MCKCLICGVFDVERTIYILHKLRVLLINSEGKHNEILWLALIACILHNEVMTAFYSHTSRLNTIFFIQALFIFRFSHFSSVIFVLF